MDWRSMGSFVFAGVVILSLLTPSPVDAHPGYQEPPIEFATPSESVATTTTADTVATVGPHSVPTVEINADVGNTSTEETTEETTDSTEETTEDTTDETTETTEETTDSTEETTEDTTDETTETTEETTDSTEDTTDDTTDETTDSTEDTTDSTEETTEETTDSTEETTDSTAETADGSGDSTDGTTDDAIDSSEETTADTTESTTDTTNSTDGSAGDTTQSAEETTDAQATATNESLGPLGKPGDQSDGTTATISPWLSDGGGSLAGPLRDGYMNPIEVTTNPSHTLELDTAWNPAPVARPEADSTSPRSARISRNSRLSTVNGPSIPTAGPPAPRAQATLPHPNIEITGTIGSIESPVNNLVSTITPPVHTTIDTTRETLESLTVTVIDSMDSLNDLTDTILETGENLLSDIPLSTTILNNEGNEHPAASADVATLSGQRLLLDDTTSPRTSEWPDTQYEPGSGPVDATGETVVIGIGAMLLAALAHQFSVTSLLFAGLATSLSPSMAALLPGARIGALRFWLWRVYSLLRYSRHDDSDPLTHEARATLYAQIRDSPGELLPALSEATGIPVSTARYHLRVLEYEDLVTGVKVHGRRRYYATHTESAELAAMHNDGATAIVHTLAAHGPLSVSALATELNRDPSTITHHLQRLSDHELIERHRDGRTVINRLTPRTETALTQTLGETQPVPVTGKAP